jgi:transcriptional regulator with XRE-family HTH domain
MCRIETGTATPSRATLAYLADRLDLPLLYFLDDTLTLTECYKHLYLADIHKAFAEEHYTEALRLLQKYFKEYDDELALIAATCLTEIAKKKVELLLKLLFDAPFWKAKTQLPHFHVLQRPNKDKEFLKVYYRYQISQTSRRSLILLAKDKMKYGVLIVLSFLNFDKPENNTIQNHLSILVLHFVKIWHHYVLMNAM